MKITKTKPSEINNVTTFKEVKELGQIEVGYFPDLLLEKYKLPFEVVKKFRHRWLYESPEGQMVLIRDAGNGYCRFVDEINQEYIENLIKEAYPKKSEENKSAK